MSINMLGRFMALEQTIFQIMETLEFLFQSGYWMINYQNDNQRPWLYPTQYPYTMPLKPHSNLCSRNFLIIKLNGGTWCQKLSHLL